MQSALAKRPIRNRLFALSLELQAIIYGYVDWEEETWESRSDKYMSGKCRSVFRRYRPNILRDPMLNYWAWQHHVALRGVPTLENASVYFCKFCESLRFREETKIIRINRKHTSCYASVCSAMCEHLELIRAETGHYDYGRFDPYTARYKAYYAKVYKAYFEDPDNKFDKDKYEELCLIYPEKRVD